MPVSRVAAVIDALAAAYDIAPGTDGVTVSKGSALLPAGDVDHLFVASDGDPVPEDEVASSEIDWAGLVASGERGTVVCAAWAQTGNQDDMSGRITRAYELVGVCEDVTPGVSLPGSLAFTARVSATRLRTIQDTEGAAAVVVFDVTFNTRV